MGPNDTNIGESTGLRFNHGGTGGIHIQQRGGLEATAEAALLHILSFPEGKIHDLALRYGWRQFETGLNFVLI
jgi:hypothetical protein